MENKIDLTPQAKLVLEKRYLKKNEKGEVIETPFEMFERVARVISNVDRFYNKDVDIEKTYENFLNVMINLEFLPNSPTLMNAGRELGLLSACFVLPVGDSLNEIFDSLKYTALIHQGGGGCIRKGSKVITSFCGVEEIDKIYEKIFLKGYKEEVYSPNAKYIDINNLNIFTLSFNSKTYKYEKDKINNIWKYNIPKEKSYTIVLEGNTEITTSEWHPFVVYNNGKIIEKEAKDIKVGDLIVGPNESLIENYLFENNKDEISIDLSYLIGYFLGDGSLTKTKNGLRMRFFDSSKELLEEIVKIIHKLTNKKYSIQRDKRSKNNYILNIYDKQLIEKIIDLTGVKPGSKSFIIKVPDYLYKCNIENIFSFLAGLIDSDGYVEKNKKRISFSTASEKMKEDLVYVLSLLGFKFSIRERKPKNKNWNIMWEVYITGVDEIEKFDRTIGKYIKNNEKIIRIKNHIKTKSSSKKGNVPFELFEEILNEAGIKTNTTEIHRKSIKIGNKYFFLSRWKEKNIINLNKILYLIDEVLKLNIEEEKREKLIKLKLILPALKEVKKVAKGKYEGEFFDFTVEKNNNYLAGINGFTLIHNTGFSFSKLRPKGDVVKSTMGVASGPISFMEVFDKATETIKQGGVRRGANMGILRIDHPDIIDFITAKDRQGYLTNFNISVAITDYFMNRYFNDEEYELINPRDGRVVKKLRAREVFDMIVEHAWKSGDPGVIFIDNINKANPTPHIGEIEATNPCGEQPLLPYESCNLGSIDVSKFVKDGKIDYERLGKVVQIGVHFLDNVIDVNKYPVQKIEEMTKLNRKIGLGVMGFHDLLIKMRIAYDSEDAIKLAEELMSFISRKAWEKSEELAIERGVFPAWNGSVHEKNGKKVRNATVTTIAPTGSISIISNCSSGIEPIFALAYKRQVAIGEWYEINPLFEKELKDRGLYSEEIMEKICEEGSVKNFDDIPDDIKKIFVTAHDIEPEWHLKIQSIFQKYVDNAVSKTVNLRNEATVDEVRKIYLMAYELGLKGVTIYRDRSKEVQVLTKGREEKEEKRESKLTPRPRPSVTYGATIKMKTGCGNLYVTINEDENGICEVFSTLGKAGGCAASQTEAISRLVSLALRSGVSPEPIIEQLKGIRCPNPIWQDGEKILSCADAIAKALEKYLSMKTEEKKRLDFLKENEVYEEKDLQGEKIEEEKSQTIEGVESLICPECGGVMIRLEGCWTCPNCGYSKCD